MTSILSTIYHNFACVRCWLLFTNFAFLILPFSWILFIFMVSLDSFLSTVLSFLLFTRQSFLSLLSVTFHFYPMFFFLNNLVFSLLPSAAQRRAAKALMRYRAQLLWHAVRRALLSPETFAKFPVPKPPPSYYKINPTKTKAYQKTASNDKTESLFIFHTR